MRMGDAELVNQIVTVLPCDPAGLNDPPLDGILGMGFLTNSDVAADLHPLFGDIRQGEDDLNDRTIWISAASRGVHISAPLRPHVPAPARAPR